MKKTAATIFILALLFVPARGARDRNPHNFQEVGCTHCHLLVPGSSRTVQKKVFRKSIDSLCQECHEAALEDNLNHRVGIRPSMRVPEDLHLSPNGELSCITCHNPHADYLGPRGKNKTYFLRRGMLKRELCLACHSIENYRRPLSGFSLLAPTNNSILNNLPAPLIGKVTDPSVKEVTLEINDTSFVLHVKKGIFSTILTLHEGINILRLSAPDVMPLSINLFYNPSIPKEMSYRLYRSHGIVTKNDCKFCHENAPVSYRIDDDNSLLCNKCHSTKKKGRHVHGPVAVGSCTTCHDPHGQTNPFLLVKTGEDLCFQCHTAADALKHLLVQGAGDKSFLREKGCGFCHDPHNAEKKFLLRDRL
jgi:predicted CXXCH cytochrome family protein